MTSKEAMVIRRESATSEMPRADGTIVSLVALVGIALASEYLLPVSNERAGAPLMANAQSAPSELTEKGDRAKTTPPNHRVAGRTFCCASTRTSRNIGCWRSRRA